MGTPQPLGIGVMMWDEVKVKDFDLWYQTTSYNIKIIIEMCECNLNKQTSSFISLFFSLFPLIFLFDSIKIFANKIVIRFRSTYSTKKICKHNNNINCPTI